MSWAATPPAARRSTSAAAVNPPPKAIAPDAGRPSADQAGCDQHTDGKAGAARDQQGSGQRSVPSQHRRAQELAATGFLFLAGVADDSEDRHQANQQTIRWFRPARRSEHRRWSRRPDPGMTRSPDWRRPSQRVVRVRPPTGRARRMRWRFRRVPGREPPPRSARRRRSRRRMRRTSCLVPTRDFIATLRPGSGA